MDNASYCDVCSGSAAHLRHVEIVHVYDEPFATRRPEHPFATLLTLAIYCILCLISTSLCTHGHAQWHYCFIYTPALHSRLFGSNVQNSSAIAAVHRELCEQCLMYKCVRSLRKTCINAAVYGHNNPT
eukprot:1897-Heterococcus_DN1.PRE.2